MNETQSRFMQNLQNNRPPKIAGGNSNAAGNNGVF